ncbi:MAG: tetratricopeptide repeat protein [Verrucomicrobiota bacterium]
MSFARRIYVSAVHEEFPETLEMLRLSLEELGCQMVTLEACPPYWRTLDKRIRDRMPTCDTVLHIVGVRCGRCPDVPTVPKGQVRRSIAQMEHEIGKELSTTGKQTPSAVHVFLSGDEHLAPDGLKPEDEAQVRMQVDHRASLEAAGGTHPTPQDGPAWKGWLIKSLGLVDPHAQASAAINLPPPSFTIRPAGQDSKSKSTGMSPISMGVIAVGVLVVGLGLLEMLKGKKPAESTAAAEVVAPYDAAKAHQALQTYVTIYRDWMRDTVDIPVMYLDHWTRLTLPERLQMSAAQVKSLLEQSLSQDVNPAFTLEDKLTAMLAAGRYQSAIDHAGLHQASLSAEGLEIAGLAAASRYDQSLSASHEDRAIRFYRGAVEKTDSQKEPENWGRRQTTLAFMLRKQGLKAEASSLAAAAVSALEKATSQPPLELAYARLVLAQTLHGEEALELGKKAVALFDQDAYKDSPLKLRAWAMQALLPGSKSSQAIELLKKTLSEAEQKLGPDHPLTGQYLSQLGTFPVKAMGQTDASGTDLSDHFSKEQLAESEAYLRRALTICEAGYGPKHLQTAAGLMAISMVVAKQGRIAEAEPTFRRALSIAVEHLGTRHPKLAGFKFALAVCLQMQGAAKMNEAEKLMREAVQEMESFGVVTKEEMAATYLMAASTLKAQKKYAEATRLMEKALACIPAHDVNLKANVSVSIVDTHMLDQRLGEARLAAEKALPVILRSKVHVDDPTKALITVMRIHAIWKQQLGEPAATLKARYQAMFKDANIDNDRFEQVWVKVSP